MNELSPKKPNLPPLKAIRQHCLKCQGGSREGVEFCAASFCKLYPFRRGTDPYRKKSELTEEEKFERQTRLQRQSSNSQKQNPGPSGHSDAGANQKSSD